MKNQYFGDINDYRKYGLLRLLSGSAKLSTAVCWMLTADDGRSDGKKVSYLKQPRPWRGFDPDLYDTLRELVLSREIRNVNSAEASGILPSARYFPELLSDDQQARTDYFERFRAFARDCDVVFFDPDNGLEVKSPRVGGKDSSKYLYWSEVTEFYSLGYSVLIYQHFPRAPRERFIQDISNKLAHKTGSRLVYSFRTPHVIFLLAPQHRHREFFEKSMQDLESVWGSQIKAGNYSGR